MVPISGTHDAGVEPGQAYPGRAKLGMVEYRDTVVYALDKLGCMAHGKLKKKGQGFVLLHDRDPSHKGGVFKQKAQELGLKVVLLPASSPDLTPMDATFFGSVVTAWRRQCLEKKLGWPARVKLFMKLLHKEKAEPHIQHWKAAVHACVQERGGHVERRLGRRHS